jgi:hypothetical protein
MSYIKELKLSEDGKDLYMRSLHPLTHMPVDNWVLLTDTYYSKLREQGKQKIMYEFKDIFNDLWHITPSHKLPELLNYYKQKVAFLADDKNFKNLWDFKADYIQELKERHCL